MMAGIAVLQLSTDGKPLVTTEDRNVGVPKGVTSSGRSPDKTRGVESQKMLSSVGSDVVSISPQGKGVGVFGLEGSPGIGGHENDGPLKDPKVNRKFIPLFLTTTCQQFSSNLCLQLLTSLSTSRSR